MREIKFRVWNKEQNKMLSYEFLKEAKIFAISPDLNSDDFIIYPQSENYILMQYTGLKDKNGVEIYEGDIVLCDTKEQIKYPVKYENGSFLWCDEDLYAFTRNISIYGLPPKNEALVIGNIYET